ncbi:CmpA/NrtA family ABC transporter substrate-binding protein [Bacillus alkalicellulosilyticus]|uniref:CmpA/NrtA family ABC transporter substrate-binding protein n=1 Tax=Alkalihalobacterium alkalicellulosilyticum TaxID=1912214 RepID=UPI0009988D67|nr:CmpA/NrtA family ABC transporter substrate-binding protein [Bacillus alkalicellulosilyticus]
MSKSISRRDFIKRSSIVGAAAFLMPSTFLAACGTSESGGSQSGDAIKIGFIPLTDCASVVMAKELGLYEKYGVNVEVTKEASWASVRDKLISGDLHAAHCLFGMPFSVYTGVGGNAVSELPIAMMLNANGQAITLSKEFKEVGFGDLPAAKAAIEKAMSERDVSFAMTFPGGTHDLWLRYWLGAVGIDQNKAQIITIPPPQMVANMQVGNMDGFCVGEPWNGVAVRDDLGFTHISTQDIWKDHPEKALVLNKAFSGRTDEVKAVMKAVLEASQWLDDLDNRKEAAKVIGHQAYVNAPAEEIENRLLGKYNLGLDLGQKVYEDDYMLFHKDGAINYPRKSHAMFFMSQYVRFGYLDSHPDYEQITDKLIMKDLYKEVASEMGIAIPDDDMKPFDIKLDGATFDPNDPAGSLKQYGGA